MEEAKPEQTQAKRNLDFLDILLCARVRPANSPIVQLIINECPLHTLSDLSHLPLKDNTLLIS